MLNGRWAALLCLAATSCAHGPDGGAISLFDGKTLNGWTPKISGYALGEDPMRTFRAEDGVIRVSYDRYGDGFKKRFGHLAYRAPFGSYRLRFEYRLVGQSMPDVESWQQSNSGVMLHGQAPATMGKNQSFPVSIEVQLLGAARQDPAPTANLCTPGTNVVMGGKLEATHCINSTSSVIPNERWTRIDLTVDRDGNFTHLVDGVQVMTYGGAQYDPSDPDAQELIKAAGGKLQLSNGYIYLQSEGHPVEFRNLELQILE
jgi:hypothetical protein